MQLLMTARRIPELLSLLLVLALLSSSLRGQTREECLACHSDQTLTMERGGKTVSLYVDVNVLDHSPHKKLVCVACHTGFDPENVPHKEKIEPVNCRTCHKDAPLKHPFHPQMVRASGSDGMPDISCKHCHGTHDAVSPKEPGSKFSSANLPEFCGSCHRGVKETFVHSDHGRALAAGLKVAPNCITCHQGSIARTSVSQDSTQLKIAQERLCLSCHLDDPNVRARVPESAGFIASYETSVHGAALSTGNGNAANCVDCHGGHAMRKATDPASRVNKLNIPQTCSKCHASIAAQYKSSVHGKALAEGVSVAPVCTDCHGEHNILKHTNPQSPVAARNVSARVCSPCHSSVKLSEKFGLRSDRFQSYEDSYHGLAGKAGDMEVANCASCHGVHDIRPSSDSTSSVNKNNLAKTCGKCHPGANENFTKGAVHVIVTAKREEILYFVSSAYIILIVVLIGGMFIHNLLDFVKKSRKQLMYRRGLIGRPQIAHKLYLRMSLNERIQHVALLISFITLVLTGFALKFPDAWWVEPVRNISPVMFELRGIMHRVAAVVLVGAGIYHLYYVFFVPRGKQLLRDLLPSLQDVTDALSVMKYNLGFSKTKPQFGRFSYIEKSEYWALVWGTIVMGVTGTILWFDNTFLGLLTKLWWDVAQTIHYYEAWLATLAIIVWHFYYVIFNPDIYPLNLAFWKGILTEEEMEVEHPLELERIRREEIEEAMVEEEESRKIRESEEIEHS
jgi:cytochrome b subunit of formate dehydrogenase